MSLSFTPSKPGQGGAPKEDSLLAHVMKAVADGANLSVGNTPSKEKEGGEKKPEGVLEQLGQKLDRDLEKGTGGMIEANKEGQGKGFDDLKKKEGQGLEAGRELLPEAGKGLERLGSIVLGADRAAGSMPKGISAGLAQEGQEAGKTAFHLAAQPLREVSMNLSAAPLPVPKLDLPRFESKGRDVVAAWGELAQGGIVAERSSKMPAQEHGLGQQQSATLAPARTMNLPGGGGVAG